MWLVSVVVRSITYLFFNKPNIQECEGMSMLSSKMMNKMKTLKGKCTLMGEMLNNKICDGRTAEQLISLMTSCVVKSEILTILLICSDVAHLLMAISLLTAMEHIAVIITMAMIVIHATTVVLMVEANRLVIRHKSLLRVSDGYIPVTQLFIDNLPVVDSYNILYAVKVQVLIDIYNQ